MRGEYPHWKSNSDQAYGLLIGILNMLYNSKLTLVISTKNIKKHSVGMNINYPHYTITTRYNICLLHKYSFVILFVILVKYCLLYKYKYLFVIDMYTCTCRNPNNQNKYYIEYNIDIIILHPLLLMNGWTNCVIIYCCLLYKLFGHNNSSLNYELMKLGGRAISAPPIRRWTTECRAISAPFPIFEL